MHHRRPDVVGQRTGGAHLLQELQKRHRRARHPEIRPRIVLELQHLARGGLGRRMAGRRRRIGQPQNALRVVDELLDAQQLNAQLHVGQLHAMLGAAPIRPVHVALDLLLLDDLVQHEDGPGVLLPHHGPEMRDGRLQRALRENVAPLGALDAHQIRIDVVGVAAVQHDARMIVRIDVAVAVQATIAQAIRFVDGEIVLLGLAIGPVFDVLVAKNEREREKNRLCLLAMRAFADGKWFKRDTRRTLKAQVCWAGC